MDLTGPVPAPPGPRMAHWLASHLVTSISVASFGHQVSSRHCWSTHSFIALPADLYLMLPLSSTSPPRFNSSLPSASPTMSALSNTFSSLVGLVGAKTPTDSTGSDEAPRQGGPWKGGHFDRLPARWNSSKSETYVPLLPVQGSETWGVMAIVADRLGVPLRASLSRVLLLHTHASISLFALPSSIGTSTNSDLREVLRVSSASLGDGIVLGARVVPPPTPTGTDWSLLVV